jgi:hypothetical protein|tara:strand:- start:358 stop:2790 length:2433 start_codon:yes stop_codon:yes gene_type:complete
MSTYNPTQPSTSFIGNDDFKWWLGTVKNADDKDAKLGRVKVNILGYHKPGEKPSNLPWAIVAGPTTSPGVHGAGSAGAQLKAGSFVIGFFLDYPDCQQPIVLGTLLSKIKPVIDPKSQEAFDYFRGVDNVIKKQNTSESGVNEAATPPQERSSTSEAAAVAEYSAANPSGKVSKVPLADGKNAGAKTLDSNLSYAVTAVATAIAQARKIDKAETEITVDTDTEDQTLFVKDTQDFPWNGWLQVGSEKVSYTNKDEGKFVSVVRGGDGTKAIAHEPGTKVKLITKSEYLGVDKDEDGNKKKGELLGTFTDTIIDLQSIVDDNLEMIRNSLYWLVNQIKSWLMGQATQIMNTLGYSVPSPGPGVTKTITEAIMFIIRQIACTFDTSLIDSLFGIIEDAINTLLNTAMDIIDSVQCVFDAIFETIFNITDLVEQVISTVNDIAAGIGGIDIENLSSLAQLNVTSVLEFIFQLLKIGCYKDTADPYAISFDSCAIGFALDCGIGGGKGVGASITGIKGRLNPQYTRILGQFSETGTMVLMDDTPYNTRLVIEHGPSKSGIHISDNGDVRITNAQRKTEVVVKDNDIIVHGNVNMMVDGNYHLKVGKDYHLEVLGHYNLSVNKESKATYYGEHKSIFKNDSRIEATNGLALTASKLGLSASGQYELFAPVSTQWVNEANNICIGSYNIITTFYNKHVGLNNFTQIVGNNILNRIGTSFEIGIGSQNKTQLGTEQDWYGGTFTEIGTGIWSENKLSADQKSTLGVSSYTKASAYVDSIVGAKFTNTTGIFSDAAQGLKFTNSAAINFFNAPLTITT